MSPEEADEAGSLPRRANPLVVSAFPRCRPPSTAESTAANPSAPLPCRTAGTLGWNPWVGERSDGRVGVSETQLGSSACAQLSVSCSHSLLLYHPWVLAQTSRFLRTGALGGRGPGGGDVGRERPREAPAASHRADTERGDESGGRAT